LCDDSARSEVFDMTSRVCVWTEVTPL
jgi:hypothetical protein